MYIVLKTRAVGVRCTLCVVYNTRAVGCALALRTRQGLLVYSVHTAGLLMNVLHTPRDDGVPYAHTWTALYRFCTELR